MDEPTSPPRFTGLLLPPKKLRFQKLIDLNTRQMVLLKVDFRIVHPSHLVPGELVIPEDIGDRQPVPMNETGFVNLVLGGAPEYPPLGMSFYLEEETTETYLFRLAGAQALDKKQMKTARPYIIQ